MMATNKDVAGNRGAMKQPDEKQEREAARSNSLREAISHARLDEAQAIDSALDLRSTELARLDLLRNSLEPVFKDIPPAEDRFELALVPSTPARLWIDMLAFIEFDAEAELYRLVRNERRGRRVLLETADAGVVRGRITEYVARQIVVRERELAGIAEPASGRRPRRSRLGLVFSAFIVGVLTGVVGLFAIGWLITQ